MMPLLVGDKLLCDVVVSPADYGEASIGLRCIVALYQKRCLLALQTKLCESKVGVGTRDGCSVGHEYGFLPPCVA